MKHNRGMMVAFLLPALLAFGIVYLYPTIRTFFMSFFYVQNITDSYSKWEYVGLENYIIQFKSSLFVQSLSNIFSIWLWSGLIVLFFAMLFAVILSSGIKFKKFFQAVIFLPNLVPAVALATMWIQYAFSSQFGLFKTIFEKFGLTQLAAFEWTSPDNMLFSMIVAFSFGMIGYYMLIFLAGIDKLPADFFEAANLEGANGWQKFTQITLPLMSDVIKTSITLWTINALTFFIWSQLFSPRNPESGSVTPMVVMYNTVFGRDTLVTDPRLINAGAGAAIGVILTLLVIIIFCIVSILIRDKKIEY